MSQNPSYVLSWNHSVCVTKWRIPSGRLALGQTTQTQKSLKCDTFARIRASVRIRTLFDLVCLSRSHHNRRIARTEPNIMKHCCPQSSQLFAVVGARLLDKQVKLQSNHEKTSNSTEQVEAASGASGGMACQCRKHDPRTSWSLHRHRHCASGETHGNAKSPKG